MAEMNSSLVSAGKPVATGAVAAAPLKTQLPTDATAKLNAAFKKLGYCGEGGLANAITVETTKIKAWGGDTILEVRTSRDETFKWTFVQALDPDVLKEVYGPENVTGEGALVVKHNGKELPRKSYVFEILLTGGRIKRIVVPDGQITSVSEVKYADGEPISYEVTMTAYPDANGDTAIEYITAPAGG